MTQHTDTAPEGANDEGVSLTKVGVADLTRHERREVIPSCDHFVIGYDSSYSDDDVTTKHVEDPSHVDKSTSRHGNVRGRLVGGDAYEDERSIGIAGSTIYASTSNGRLGSLLWVKYPKPEPAKTTYKITFRALAGNYSSNIDDVDEITEYAVDKYAFDGVEAPPEEYRRFEDVPVKPSRDGGEPVTERRAVVDVPVTITVADVAFDTDELIEHVRSTFGSSSSAWYDTLQYRADLPAVDADANRVEKEYGSDRFVRAATRYMVEDVTVEVVDDHGADQ